MLFILIGHTKNLTFFNKYNTLKHYSTIFQIVQTFLYRVVWQIFFKYAGFIFAMHHWDMQMLA